MIIAEHCRPGGWRNREGAYTPSHEWPADCYVQWGGTGVVGSPEGVYTTAFFEAFPTSPRTFLRGEGVDVVAAEAAAWRQWLVVSACPGHEFEARGYENGYGICKHCGMGASKVIAPERGCLGCAVPTWYGKDNQGDFWCRTCIYGKPLIRYTASDARMMRDLYAIRAENMAWERWALACLHYKVLGPPRGDEGEP